MSMADPLGLEIGGIGLSLGVSFLKINTIVGLLIGPACGVLMDKFKHPSDGYSEICILMASSFAVVALCCGVANWMVQIVVLIFVCVSQTIQLLLAMRYGGKSKFLLPRVIYAYLSLLIYQSLLLYVQCYLLIQIVLES